MLLSVGVVRPRILEMQKKRKPREEKQHTHRERVDVIM
jgi:hypothetical protein